MTDAPHPPTLIEALLTLSLVVSSGEVVATEAVLTMAPPPCASNNGS